MFGKVIFAKAQFPFQAFLLRNLTGFLAIQKYQRLVSGTPQRAAADFHFDQVTHHHFTKKSLTPSRVNSSQQWSHPIARKVTGNFACQRNRGRAGRHFTAVTASLSLQSYVETRRTGPPGGAGGGTAGARA